MGIHRCCDRRIPMPEPSAQLHEIAALSNPRRSVRVTQLVEGRNALVVRAKPGGFRRGRHRTCDVAVVERPSATSCEHKVRRLAMRACEFVTAERCEKGA